MEVDPLGFLPPGCENVDTQPSPLASQAGHMPDPRFTTKRSGEHWMDGHAVVVRAFNNDNYQYLRPWDDCIPVTELSIYNLPPFYVRLNDNQVGHLKRWVNNNKADFPTNRLGQLWPADFLSTKGDISTSRYSWGPAFKESDRKGREMQLVGWYSAPTYVNPNLAPTYTSSGRLMRQEANSDKTNTATKRPLTEMDAVETSTMIKKACVDSENSLRKAAIDPFEPFDDQKPKEVDRSRDEVIQTLVQKIDRLVSERSDMEVKVEELKQESINASEIAQGHEKTIRQLKRTTAVRKRQKADLEASLSIQKRLVATTKRESAEHMQEACRLGRIVKENQARLDATKENIRTYIEALGELTNGLETSAPNINVRSHPELNGADTGSG